MCVKPCLLRAKNVVRCSVLCFLLKQGAAGLSLTLRPTKTVIERCRCVNVPARDALGRNGRSWGSHMNPPLNSCINVGLSGRWAHDAHVWFFRTCRMRLDDAVGDLLTSPVGDGYTCVSARYCQRAGRDRGRPDVSIGCSPVCRFHSDWIRFTPGFHRSRSATFIQRYLSTQNSFHQLNTAFTGLIY